MEQYYVKVGKRYIPAGYSMPDLADGFYFVQKTPFGRRSTSVNYWAGSNPPQPLDAEKLVSYMSKDDSLARYIIQIQDPNSEEFQKVKEDQGIKGNEIKITGLGASDLAQCILRFLFENESNYQK